MLYIRLLVTIVVGLFTVRLLLQALGTEDYGIFNLVAGLITLFSFVTSSMNAATNRYLAYALGKGDHIRFNQLFSLTFIVYAIAVLGVTVIAIPVGWWLLNYQLTIPANRLDAANWVFFYSICTFAIRIFTIPYICAINSHERMGVYAWMSIFESILRLFAIVVLWYIPFDKLSIYGLIIFFQELLIFFMFRIYCIHKLEGCRFIFYWDKTTVKELFSFTGWNFLGSLTAMLRTQGINILLNIFFGPIANAAKAISDRINSVIQSFIANYYAAITPQITKLYASNEKEQMKLLAYKSSKFSFFLMWVMSLPLILETPSLIKLWLGTTSPLWNSFTRLTLLFLVLLIFEPPITKMIMAMGQIRNYQSWVAIITLLSLPICYILFSMGYSPETCFYVLIIVYIIAFIPRLLIMKRDLGFSIMEYLVQVIRPSLLVGFISIWPPIIIQYLLPDDSFINTILVVISAVFSITFCALFIGMNNTERIYIKRTALQYINIIKHHKTS
ncbi:hypothetical protein D0T84_05775 [Dysgonomonas sp. 521]|nr:hypothetical protein [Dysgonomonas sp. 521]